MIFLIKGAIDLFYGDESHICTESYVLYGIAFLCHQQDFGGYRNTTEY